MYKLSDNPELGGGGLINSILARRSILVHYSKSRGIRDVCNEPHCNFRAEKILKFSEILLKYKIKTVGMGDGRKGVES